MNSLVPEGKFSGMIFKELFQDKILHDFDWDTMAEATYEVTWVKNRRELGNLKTLWRKTSPGQLADHDEEYGRCITVAEAAERYGETPSVIPSACRRHINRLMEDYRKNFRPFMMPGVGLDGEVAILDGNHRAVALYLSSLPVRAILTVAHHPALQEKFRELGEEEVSQHK